MPEKLSFDRPLHVGRPNLGDQDRLFQRLRGALDRLWLSNDGPLVREFEARIAAITETRHCIATCNATSGLQIAAKASGISTGDEVIVPSFTWVATAHALDWVGITPVFCDVDEESGCADPKHVERLITPRTRGILGVHVFGYPCDADSLSKLAQQHEIPLLFDAAHAFGCTRQGKPIGGFGNAEVFSFHATKYVNSFEGGAIMTNDDDLAERARAMRNMGLSAEHEVAFCGTVARLNEGAAAMGLTSLERMDRFIEVNKRNHELYREALAGVPGVTVRPQAVGERANHQYLVIEVDAAEAGVHRDAIHSTLYAHNVLSRRYFYPGCHQIAPYRADPGRHTPLPLPRTEALTERVLALPTGTAIGPDEIAGIARIIRRTVGAARG
ncbi:aminotransferase class I/II-fold pyridoxal phosphate-dependent enzyme [Amycolatopsis anabasis]|uniref:aminotransferase class I/II-fold pyridoxal phosphate-dependent enzyme n=1 Tax=Amycolatopsis anabasis TaxID=1840409 RepID=UPI00131E7A0B|nr:aminotransferase class I/II-fold pyridoxal phosphate-dependent enzyme [Amycolatopsis anabasis]